MPIDNIIKKIFRCLRHIFIFKKPVIINLDHIDIVFQKKGFFLLSWNVSHVHTIRIRETKSIFFSKKGSAVIKLPENISSLTVIAKNTWKKSETAIRLRRVAIDTNLYFDFITKFESFKVYSPKEKFSILSKLKVPRVSLKSPLLKKKPINFRLPSITIKQNLITYHHSQNN